MTTRLCPLLLVLTLVPSCRARMSAAPDATPPAEAAPAQTAALKETTATFATSSGGHASFRLEVAEKPTDRFRGLMYRRSMAPDRGMLFVFAVEQVQEFYMKNTYIPLDMVFVSRAGRVAGVVEDARPLTLETRAVDAPSTYVIELNAHTARTAGIAAGSTVTFDPPPPDVDE